MQSSVFLTIKSLLDSHDIAYRSIHHEPTRTSEESAKARGEDLAVGGKAILMKVDDAFTLFVLSAAKKIDSRKIKQHFAAKKLRFANAEELLQLTGLVPGSVPPFGKPMFPFKLLPTPPSKQTQQLPLTPVRSRIPSLCKRMITFVSRAPRCLNLRSDCSNWCRQDRSGQVGYARGKNAHQRYIKTDSIRALLQIARERME